ncbi:hypothetical protein [Oceaniradius stylonematis]|uniref:hypothetical protein n=1 Tax=Oceaniradius stylonematis TaxID=2184161 RepID=UPI003C799DB9
MFADLALPPEEQERARFVQQNLDEMKTQHKRFNESLALFDYCETQRRAVGEAAPRDRFGRRMYPKLFHSMFAWQSFAGREGAMAIWDFAAAMHLVQSNLNHCPTIKALVHRRDLGAAIASFHAAFPDAKDIRHAVSHPVDIVGTPANQKKNAFTGSYEEAGVRITDSSNTSYAGINGRRFAVTIYGKIIGYELASASAQKLAEIANAIRAACLDAQKYTMERFHELLLAGKIKGTPYYTGNDE